MGHATRDASSTQFQQYHQLLIDSQPKKQFDESGDSHNTTAVRRREHEVRERGRLGKSKGVPGM